MKQFATSTLSGAVDSVATQINPATGELLADLGTIKAVGLWLTPFKFVGIAMLLTGIVLSLATIVHVLRWQSNRLWTLLAEK